MCKTFFECLIAVFLPHVVLTIFGLVFFAIGLLGFNSSKDIKAEVGILKNISIKKASKVASIIFLFAGGFVLAVALIWFARSYSQYSAAMVSVPNPSADNQIIYWPKNNIQYIDFENSDDLKNWSKGWGNNELAIFKISNAKSFTGSKSMAVTVTNEGSLAFLVYNQPLKANYIMGQIYWPKQDGIQINWAQVSIGGTGDHIEITKVYDHWNTFIFDLSRLAPDGTPENQMEIPIFYIQGQVLGATKAKPYTFYVDGIQIYPAYTAP